jgi:hypothetical protein
MERIPVISRKIRNAFQNRWAWKTVLGQAYVRFFEESSVGFLF